MQKTPVSILQELMIKKKSVPNYELIYDGGGTHENTFTYQVVCAHLTSSGALLSAIGTGRSKKDAKHLAAKNMLSQIAAQNAYLPLPASPAESPVRTPNPQPHVHSPNGPFINAIGDLKDLCAEYELPQPVYLAVSDVGPPHARVFTIHCILLSFTEEGRSTTKKHTKHIAARKMYERVNNIIMKSKSPFDTADEIEKQSNSVEMSAPENQIEQIHKSNDIFPDFGELLSNPRKDLGVKVADYYKTISDPYSVELREQVTSELLQFEEELASWKVDDVDHFEESVLNRLKETVKVLNLSVKRLIFNVEDNLMLALYVDTVPNITEVAIDSDKTELVRRVFTELACTLRILFS